jgi:photosystem II stability/assembly factor-like uncharacterized protein
MILLIGGKSPSGYLRNLLAILALPMIVGAFVAAFGWPGARDLLSPHLRYGMHAGSEPADLAWVRQAGFDWAVVVFSWRDIEPLPGNYFWEMPDAFLRAARFHRLHLAARLDHPPDWALRTPSAGQSPVDLAAYARFVEAVAARYRGRVPAYVIWNEPNLSVEWGNATPDAPGYATLLKTGYKAVKNGDPDALVVSAGLAPTNDVTPQARDERIYLRELYAAGAAPYFDALGAHPYGFAQPPSDPRGAHQGLNFARLEDLRAIMVEAGDGDKEIWATEFGWTTRTDDPAQAWQEVSPEVQATYLTQAYELGHRWPWLGLLAVWHLGPADDGYNLLSAGGEPRAAYRALAAMLKPGAVTPPLPPLETTAQYQILAPDVIIRLGGRDQLHPHWVHIYHSQVPSLRWQGDFYLTAIPSGRWQLVIGVMHVRQADDYIWLNDKPLIPPTLPRRGKPDPGSNWVTARFDLPADALRPGRNTLAVVVGPRLPDCSFSYWRHDNFQFRDVRLEPVPAPPVPAAQEVAIPMDGAGWTDVTALAAGPEAFYAATYSPGQLYRSVNGLDWNLIGTGLSDALVLRIVPTASGRLWVATNHGIFWSDDTGRSWAAVPGLPDGWWTGLAYDPDNNTLCAGRLEGGIYHGRPLPVDDGRGFDWHGPALSDLPVLSIAAGSNAIYAATAQGPYRSQDCGATWLAVGKEAHFIRQTVPLADGTLVARADSGLYRSGGGDDVTWKPLAATEVVADGLTFAITGLGWLVGTAEEGVYRSQDMGATWTRLGPAMPGVEVTAIVERSGVLLAGGRGGLRRSADGGQSWERVGPPVARPVVTALVASTNDPMIVYAGTPGGVYRTDDGGETWHPIGPGVWVHALALSPDGRTLYMGAEQGVYRGDNGGEIWERNGRMAGILFYALMVDPNEPDLVYGGTWGNNLARSSDGGKKWRPVHHGLETLTVHSILLNPANPAELWVGTVEDIYRSDDRGETWQALKGPRVGATTYTLCRDGVRGTVLAGASDGLYRSTDNGTRWEKMSLGVSAAVVVLGEHEGVLYAGTEGAGLYRSADGGETWQAWGASLAGHSIYALLPRPDGRLWVGGDMGLLALVTGD